MKPKATYETFFLSTFRFFLLLVEFSVTLLRADCLWLCDVVRCAYLIMTFFILYNPVFSGFFCIGVFTSVTYTSLTVRDRAISSKFSTNGGHFEFSNFRQKCENTKMLLSP